MDITEQLNWRYAVQKFDTDKKVSDDDFDVLLEALRLSPSSFGLQPWKFIVVENKDTREKLKEAAYGQSKVTDASHFIVLCSLDHIDVKHVDKYVENVAKTRNQSVESLGNFRAPRAEFINNSTKEKLDIWMSEQVYIALGILLSVCAVNNIDAGPMSGFDHNKFDEILNLKNLGLKSQVACAIGYRAADDKTASHKKARFDKKDIIIKI